MPHPPTLDVRAADAGDLDAIVAFGATVVPSHYEPIIGRVAAEEQVELWWTRQHLGAAVADETVLVADTDQGIVGLVETGLLDGDPVIWKLYVHPRHRSRGIGAKLLHATIDSLPSTTRRVILEHFAGNHRAADFYEREGFAHLRTDPSPSGEPAAATVWRARDRELATSASSPIRGC